MADEPLSVSVSGNDIAVVVVGEQGPSGISASKQISFSVRNPAPGFIPGIRLSEGLTPTEVSIGTDSGQADVNIERRTAIASAGDDLFASDQTATSSGVKVSSLQNTDWVDDDWIGVSISSVTSAPGYLVITITATPASA